MATFASDNFTGTDGTLLSAHTPSGGGSWSDGTGAAEEFEISNNNRLKTTSSDLRFAKHSGTPASAEYDVLATFVVVSVTANSTMGICGRIAAAANTCYFARYNHSSTQWQLFKVVSGTATQLATYSQSLSAGNTLAIKLELRDAAKKFYIDGVERLSSADNVITAAGQAGVRAGGTGSNTTGQHLDDWSAEETAAATGKPAYYYQQQLAGAT